MKTRRMFLRTAGGAALGMPFLSSLLPRSAKADIGGGPRRFVALQSQSGQFAADFWPVNAPAGYQTRDQMYGGDRSDGTVALHEPIPGGGGWWGSLSDFEGTPLSPVLGDYLEPYYDKMNIVRGLDYLQGTSHGTGMMLGNYANCASVGEFASRGMGWMPTIDQVLAHSPAFYEAEPRARSIVMASGSPTSTLSDTDYGIQGADIEGMYGYLEPLHLWEDLFGDFMDPEMPMEHPNRRLVAALYDDYVRLRSHQRLSLADRQTLEQHMAFIDDIENQLANNYAPACEKPDAPPDFDVSYPYQEVTSVDDFVSRIELMVDISAAALRCDLSRVATFNLQMAVSDASGTPVTSYHSSDDVAGDWHDFAHDAEAEPLDHEHIISLNRWVGEVVFRRYLERLDVQESGGETYLDNSIVYWGGELSVNHYVVGLPTVVAGGGGGCIETGRYVDYTMLTYPYANAGVMPWGVLIPGMPHKRLLTTILQSMGLSPNDYERDGLAGYGHDEHFGGPYNLGPDPYDYGAMGEPLPGIFLG